MTRDCHKNSKMNIKLKYFTNSLFKLGHFCAIAVLCIKCINDEKF